MSKPDLFELPAGPVAALIGLEYRKETYIDDRDPYLDGSVPNSLFRPNISSTKTHPYTSGVVGSSPTSDVMGDKNVQSLFVELSIPVSDKISAQVAARHEEFSDSISATVGKIAIGYDVTNRIKFRASASTSFRPPNLVQVNQEEVARTGSRYDAVMQLLSSAKNFNGAAPSSEKDGVFIDDFYVLNSIRYATGAEKLVPEGVEGQVPYTGSVQDIIHQMIGGLRQSMGYTGSHDIATMRTKPKFVQITSAGVNESHVHDVSVTKEAPNYRMS